MKASRRIIVIMESGKVVGTQFAPTSPPVVSGVSSVSATLQAGPGQTLHEVFAPMPDRLDNAEHIARFHETLANLVSKKKRNA